MYAGIRSQSVLILDTKVVAGVEGNKAVDLNFHFSERPTVTAVFSDFGLI